MNETWFAPVLKVTVTLYWFSVAPGVMVALPAPTVYVVDAVLFATEPAVAVQVDKL